MQRPTSSGQSAPELPFWKKLLFLSILGLFLLAVLEVGARLVYFVKADFNPYFLTVGFVPDAWAHVGTSASYAKFEPDATRYTKIAGETVPIRINSDGYRGPYDFEKPKPPGVFRIAALGASSTFGYYNRDDQTYPYLLEQLLAREFPDRRIEVLNLGIPEFRMANILALAEAELGALQPDVVTLYTGANNATRHKDRGKAGVLYRTKDWLYSHSVVWRVLNPVVAGLYYKLAGLVNRDVAGLPNLAAHVCLTEPQIAGLRDTARREFRSQVEQLADLIHGMGARLLLITQNYTLHELKTFPLHDPWLPYEEEAALVRETLEQDGCLIAPHSTMLIHHALMQELRDIASARNLPLLEGIEVLDQDRSKMLASWVHPTPAGNRRLAAAIRAALTEHELVPYGALAGQ